ncbi:hypothetical protein CQ046_20380 [Chryseobacterium sp. MYb7]|nr:hypothetical protein CQ046_20380 [Chryseobacterium sp. MYb7]
MGIFSVSLYFPNPEFYMIRRPISSIINPLNFYIMSTPDTSNFKATRVDAGAPNLWHVHEGHFKYGSIKETRVNFAGRTLEQIMAKIAENEPTNTPYMKTDNQVRTYEDCIKWIKKNC